MEIMDSSLIKASIDEFSSLQSYMEETEKTSAVYKLMKKRYVALKVFLTASGVNLTELDTIKE